MLMVRDKDCCKARVRWQYGEAKRHVIVTAEEMWQLDRYTIDKLASAAAS